MSMSVAWTLALAPGALTLCVHVPHYVSASFDGFRCLWMLLQQPRPRPWPSPKKQRRGYSAPCFQAPSAARSDDIAAVKAIPMEACVSQLYLRVVAGLPDEALEQPPVHKPCPVLRNCAFLELQSINTVLS